MKTLFATVVALFLFSFASQAQFSTVFNSSIAHVYTEPVAGLSLDHEIMFNYSLAEADDVVGSVLSDFSLGASLEYNYFPLEGKTYNVGLVNANLTYAPSFLTTSIPAVPYIGASFSYVEMLDYDDNGTGFTWLVGSLFPISNNASFFLQVRVFDFNTETELGKTMIQTGFSYILQ
jgi:hypothetical protein